MTAPAPLRLVHARKFIDPTRPRERRDPAARRPAQPLSLVHFGSSTCLDLWPWTLVPTEYRRDLFLYGLTGLRPGPWLSAVLANDLCAAVQRGRRDGLGKLPGIVTFLYQFAPIACWGSPEAVERWTARGGIDGCPVHGETS